IGIRGENRERLVAVDPGGTISWEARVKRLVGGQQQLLDGNFLLVTGNREDRRVVELGQSGKPVWEAVTGEATAYSLCLPLVRLGFDRPRPKDHDIDTVVYRARALKSPNVTQRARAAAMLEEFGAEGERFLPDLIEALGEPDIQVRGPITRLLGSLGSKAERAVPKLIEALDDPHNEWAGAALVRIGTSAIDYLRKAYQEH